MKTYDSLLYGKLDAPENFMELLEVILKSKINESDSDVSYWRGQSDIDWKLNPSIVRRILLSDKKINEEKMDKYIFVCEDNLLQRAKKNCYDYDGHGRLLGDLELLAKLQHQGAATRLLDFSKNVLIALWFCVSDTENRERVGVLFGLNTEAFAGPLENVFDFQADYSTFFDRVCSSNKIWMIDAPNVVSRVFSQSSVFLCSKSVSSNHGYFMLPDDERHKKIIAISPTLKTSCLKILSECFNITPYTIFPDIEGFSKANSAQWRINEFDRW